MPDYRTFYRIVLTDPPSLDDMRSYDARGIKPRRDDPETLRLIRGISVYNTEQQARNTATDFPWLGRYIAELRIPHDAPVTIERTTSTRGHYTVWGDAHAILGLVAQVRSV